MYPLGCAPLLAIRRAGKMPPGPVLVILDGKWRPGLQLCLALPPRRRPGELDWSPLALADVALMIDDDTSGNLIRELVRALAGVDAGAVFVIHRERGLVAMPRNPWLSKR